MPRWLNARTPRAKLAFVERFAALRSKVKGVGNLERSTIG